MTVQVTVVIFISCFLVNTLIRIAHADEADVVDVADDTDAFTDADDADANK